MSLPKPAVLALEDGSVYHGLAFGADATVAGECVFNTSMTGYQEILTDPSYFGQIVTMTAVQIGNYGISPEDAEAAQPMCSGFVVRELSPIASNWRSTIALSDYLKQYGIPGISEIDTRALTKKLRVDGAMKCCISTLPITDEEAVKQARGWQDMAGSDYVKDVTCDEPYIWGANEAERYNAPYLPAGTTFGAHPDRATRFRVAAFDFGAKHTIFRKLIRHGFDVQVFPSTATPEMIREHAPDGLFLSNGPGDPAALEYVHRTVNALLPELPTFGICLGHQMMGLAIGAGTRKMAQGHHGANHPVMDFTTGKVEIVSMNHGFTVDKETLPANAKETHKSLFDGTNSGIALTDRPAFSVQHHPEASPGPQDSHYLFQRFVELMEEAKA